MPTFVWKGRTLAGEAQAGEIEVGRQDEALELLRKRKILVTSLRAKGGFKLGLVLGDQALSDGETPIELSREVAILVSLDKPAG